MKRTIILSIMLILVLSGCNQKNIIETTENTVEMVESQIDNIESKEDLDIENDSEEIMEGMQYLFAWETDGACLVVNGLENIGDPYILIDESNEIKVIVESTGKRKMAVQVLIDYVQVPLVVDNQTCDSYYIETEDNISLTKQIKLDIDIDRSVDHKITIILLNDLQKNAGETEGYILEGGGITIDRLLVCDKEKDKLKKQISEYEVVEKVYEDQFNGVLFTLDENGNRKLIKDTIKVKPGEELKFYYHLGGFSESEETVMFLDIGEKQVKINDKDFLLFQGEPTKILYGEAIVKAPLEEGKYEVTVWAVNNPYGKIEQVIQTVDGAPRFTLNVVKE